MPTLEEKIESKRFSRRIESRRQERSGRDEGFGVLSGETQLRQDRPIRQKISGVVRPVLEFGGATIGGVIGLGAGLAIPTIGEEPFTLLAGESLGFAAGRNLADFFDSLLGLRTSRTERTLTEKVKGIPADIAEGAKISITGQATGVVLTKGFEKFFGPSKLFTPEKQELVRIARENNINLTPAEITETSPLALFESLLDKLMSSSGRLQRNHLETLEGIVTIAEKLKAKGAPAEVIELLGSRIIDATNRSMKVRQDISTAALIKIRDRTLNLLGTSKLRFITGEEIQIALKPRSKRAQARVTEKFNRFWELVRPDEEIADNAAQIIAREILEEDVEVPIRNTFLRRIVKKIAKRPVETEDELAKLGLSQDILARQTPEIQQQLLQEAGLVEVVPTAKAFDLRRKALNEVIREEDFATKSGIPGFKGQNTMDGGRASRLKAALDQDLATFSESRGGEVLERFNEALAVAGRFKRLYGSPEMRRIITADPGKVLDTIVQTDKVNEWRVFKKAADADSIEKIKQSFVAKLIGPDDAIDPKFVASQMKRYQPGILNEVLGEGTVKSLKNISKRVDAINQLSIQDPLFKTIARRDPGQVFGTIIKRGSPRVLSAVDASNIQRINKLEAEGILDEVGLERLKARYLEELFTFNKQDRLPPQSVVRNITEFGSRTKERLLNVDEIADLEIINRIAKAARGAERLAGNPSGTAQNIMSFSSAGMILRHPIKNGFGLILVPQVAASVYLSPAGRKLLVEGFTTPRGTIRAAEIFTRLAAIVGSDFAIDPRQAKRTKPDIQELIKSAAPFQQPTEQALRQGP